MKEFVDKLIGRLEEFKSKVDKTASKEQIIVDVQNNLSIDSAINIINRLADEYNNGWIPCEKELPKDDNEVLCWYEYRIMDGTHEGEMNQVYGIGWYSKTYKRWFGEVSNGRDCKVIAWQKLPQPYKVGDLYELS